MRHEAKIENLSPSRQIVVTGASSGICLATALQAAESGAQVVLAARNEAALQKIVASKQPLARG